MWSIFRQTLAQVFKVMPRKRLSVPVSVANTGTGAPRQPAAPSNAITPTADLRDDIEPILAQLRHAMATALKREDSRQETIEGLYNLVMTSMRMLHEFPLEDLRSFARKKYVFPFPVYQHPDSLLGVQNFMARLELGKLAPIDMRVKSKGGKASFRLTTRSVQMAFAYYHRLVLIRHISPASGLRVLNRGGAWSYHQRFDSPRKAR